MRRASGAGRAAARRAGTPAAVVVAAALLLALFSGDVSAQAPQRVVSLDLCTDWLLARYAPRGHVAALSPLSRQWPVEGLDSSWPAHDGTLEHILQLKPDLVLAGQFNAPQLRSRLQSLGVRVEVLPLPDHLDGIAGYERRLLGLLGLPADGVEDEPVPPAPSTSGRRLLLLGANGIGTGRGTLEDDILRRAGWTNYLRDEGYLALDLERLVADPPDAILWAAPASPALANRFAVHPALRRATPAPRWLATDTWRWQCPGPWTWNLVRQLRDELIRLPSSGPQTGARP